MSDQIYQAPTVPRAAPNFRVIAMIVASAMLMENIDATVLATALPTMRAISPSTHRPCRSR